MGVAIEERKVWMVMNRVSLSVEGMGVEIGEGVGNGFDRCVVEHCGEALRGVGIDVVQVNVGLRCNLACHHCHVESSPKREEEMRWEVMEAVLRAAKESEAKVIDITGGAPEMNVFFRQFVKAAKEVVGKVMVRTNLTIMLEEGYEDLPGFYEEAGVHLVASLPCYLAENVNKQRGLRVYEESVEVIRRLNAVGYGVEERLELDLVYNPVGAHLPPDVGGLERDYRKVLGEEFGIQFTRLIGIANMPIGRFLHDLERDGLAEGYERLLRESFNGETIEGLMCRHQLHVAYDGRLSDCDFNYALGLGRDEKGGVNIRDVDVGDWVKRRVVTGEHCFGCTAGVGSSCGGALA